MPHVPSVARTTSLPRTVPVWTLADVQRRFKDIPPHRIRLNPAPGTATEKDVLRLMDEEKRLYELVDGVLVEKVMGFLEGGLAARLGRFLEEFGEDKDVGTTFGADAAVRLMPRMVRIPDVSFVTWEQLPERCYPKEPIPDLAPDVAAEVLSEGNTAGEMQEKLEDYFRAGVRLVWLIEPKSRTVTVYTSPTNSRQLHESDTLDGGEVLRGFRLPLKRLFLRMPPSKEGKAKRRR